MSRFSDQREVHSAFCLQQYIRLLLRPRLPSAFHAVARRIRIRLFLYLLEMWLEELLLM